MRGIPFFCAASGVVLTWFGLLLDVCETQIGSSYFEGPAGRFVLGSRVALQPELLYSEVAQRFAELFHVPVSIANPSQRGYGEASTSLASMDGTQFVLLWANCDLNDPTLKWSPKRPLLKLLGGQFGIHSKKLVWVRDSGSAVSVLGGN